jgi:hypothetical protein
MSSKVYKGQGVIVEGSLAGETIIISKFAYDSTLSLEYLGEAKAGTSPSQNKWFIQKFFYDSTLSLTDIKNATNRTNVGATMVSIDASNPNLPIITISNGDFSEVNSGDTISLTTPTQNVSGYPIRKISDTQISINFLQDCGQPPAVSVLSETNTSISLNDFIITLSSDATKDWAKRRWDHRDRYVYE